MHYRLTLRSCLCFIALVLLTVSCREDNVVSAEPLDGKWNIHTALRNQKVTKTLKGGYFAFEGDTSMITNIWGSEQSYTFERKGSKITTTEGVPQLDLTIKSASADSLTLLGKIQVFDMEFQMVRDTAQ